MTRDSGLLEKTRGGARGAVSDSGVSVRVRRSLPARASRVATACPSCGIPLVVRLVADSKTTPRAIWDARKGATAVYAQAIPLGPSGPPSIGGTCPGWTSGLEHDGQPGGCDGCYWQALEGRYSGLEALGAANLRAFEHVERCGGARGLASVFVDVLDHLAAFQLEDGLERVTVRWSPGGDIRSETVARAIARAHRARPSVEGWIYTRTLAAVRHLVGLENLRAFVSVDRVNAARAARVAARWGAPVAVLAADRLEAARVWDVVRAVDLEGSIPAGRQCPAAGGKYSSDGRGPAHIVDLEGRRRGLERGGLARGACDSCNLCLPSGLESSVTFLQHGGNNVWPDSVRVSIRSAGAS